MQGKKEEHSDKNVSFSKPGEDNDSLAKLEIVQKIKTIGLLSENASIFAGSLAECIKTLCKTTKSGYWLYNPQDECVWFSDELIELLNLPKNKDLIISAFENQIIQGDEKDKFFESLYNFLNYKQLNEFEIRIKDAKNQKILINSLSNIKFNETEFVIGIVKDITRQIQYDEELAKQKEKAIESDRIKSVFLKNISHEIRTPMNSIVGFIELLDIRDFSSEKKQEFLSIIKSKSKYLLSLIDDIAELSKFESGEISINKSETNLSKLLNELLQKYYTEKALQNKNNIELYLHLPTDLKETIAYTDPGRIQQIMSYLLDNALKYTEKGYVQFGYEIKDNKQIAFFVKDTGIGIAKESQKYLFNRFRINEDTIDSKNQSGLGLTISRAIVEQLGGKIGVESTPGQGSTFSFSLPLIKADKIEVKEQSEEKHLKPNWRNKVILVAEDDDVNYHFLEAVLAESQARLIHVHNGQQAIELCHTLTNIDLILMDIRMPEKNGHDAVKEIKKFRKEIPIIAQTAYTGKEEREKCLQTGCDDYISKPIDIESLITKINSFLSE